MTDQQSTSTPPGGEGWDFKERALEAIETGIQTQYKKNKKRVPKGTELRKMAEERYESSKKNGPTNHIGIAEGNI